jgi:transposase-like protein
MSCCASGSAKPTRTVALDQQRLSSTERQELRHLRAEVKTLRMERDSSKEVAAAFFARESDRTR